MLSLDVHHYEEYAIDEAAQVEPWRDVEPEEVPAMHVTIDDTGDVIWHRLTVDRARAGSWYESNLGLARTACGLPLAGHYYRLREESYSDELCLRCFTSYEMKIADELANIERDRENAEERARRQSWTEHKVKREADQERIDTALGKVPKKPEEDK
jgi:hypothetical protein